MVIQWVLGQVKVVVDGGYHFVEPIIDIADLLLRKFFFEIDMPTDHLKTFRRIDGITIPSEPQVEIDLKLPFLQHD